MTAEIMLHLHGLLRASWRGKRAKENAYMYLGYALHPLQDKEAHGQIGRGKSTPQHLVSYTKGDNITHADDKTGWEWTNSSRNALKAVSGSKKDIMQLLQ